LPLDLNLFPPQLALVVGVKRQREWNLLQRHQSLGLAHLYRSWKQDEMALVIDTDIDVNSFKLAPRLKAVPVPNFFADRPLTGSGLDSIMPDLARDDLAVLCKLVIPVYRYEWAAGNAVWRLKHDRAGPSPSEKLLYVIRQ